MGRSPCCQKEGLKKGPWTSEEDQTLVAYIALHGHGNWRALPKKCGLLRCGKSCRLRWTNYLRPDIKRGRFSEDEENKIIQLHAIVGNKWAMIASHLPQRTDNEIKNHWNTVLKKKLQKMDLDKYSYLQEKSRTDSPKLSTWSSSISHLAQWESVRLETEARLAKESEMRKNTAGIWSRISSKAPDSSTCKTFGSNILKDQKWLHGKTNHLLTTAFSSKESFASNSTGYGIEMGSGRSASLCSQNSDKLSWNWNYSLDLLSTDHVANADFQPFPKGFSDIGLHEETAKLDSSTLCYPAIFPLEEAATRMEVESLDNTCPSLQDLHDLLFEDDNDSCSKHEASSLTHDGSKTTTEVQHIGELAFLQSSIDAMRIRTSEVHFDDDCSDNSRLHEAISKANELAGELSRDALLQNYDSTPEENATETWNNMLMQLFDARPHGNGVSVGES